MPALTSGGLLARRYRLVDQIGAGGMSVIWRARDEVLDRMVAVKVLAASLAADDRFRGMVREEARAAAQLVHPHVTAVHDYGESVTPDGEVTAFVVMELLVGEELETRLRDGPLPWAEAVEICSQVAAALAAAHRLGIVHRDVTPSNVMMTATGAKVLDFGIATYVGAPDEDEDGGTFGTPAYVAPERLDGTPAQPATDAYSLGVLLYETLTGRVPFPADTWDELTRALADAAEPPPLAVPGVPAPVVDVCLRCLARNPHDRPTARQVADTLRAQLPGGGTAGDRRPGDPTPGDPTPGDPAPDGPAPRGPTPDGPTPGGPTRDGPASGGPASGAPVGAGGGVIGALLPIGGSGEATWTSGGHADAGPSTTGPVERSGDLLVALDHQSHRPLDPAADYSARHAADQTSPAIVRAGAARPAVVEAPRVRRWPPPQAHRQAPTMERVPTAGPRVQPAPTADAVPTQPMPARGAPSAGSITGQHREDPPPEGPRRRNLLLLPAVAALVLSAVTAFALLRPDPPGPPAPEVAAPRTGAGAVPDPSGGRSPSPVAAQPTTASAPDEPRRRTPRARTPSPSQPAQQPVQLTVSAAIAQVGQLVDDGLAAGAIRSDAGVDLHNLIHNLRVDLAGGHGDVAGSIARIRDKVAVRAAEGSISPEYADRLNGALRELAAVAA